MPVCGSGAVVCSLSLLFAAIFAAFRQKLHLSTCSVLPSQLSQPPAGQLRTRQSVHEAAHTNTMRNGLMPKLQPDTAIAGKKHQSIRRLDNHILKITTQTN